jgi:GTPase SAR1 family protein
MHRIVKSAFPGGDDYLPTLWDNAYLKFNSRQNKEFLLELYEAHSREEYDRLRPLSYLAAHFVIICYPCAVPKGTEKFTNRDDSLTKTEEIVR